MQCQLIVSMFLVLAVGVLKAKSTHKRHHVAGDGYQLNRQPSGDTFVKAVGQSVVFRCTLLGNVPPTDNVAIVWRDNFGRIVSKMSGAKSYVQDDEDTPYSSRLFVTNIAATDAGRYSCELTVNGVKKLSDTLTLTIFKDITFDSAPSPQNPEKYTDALIICQVSGEPKPEVSWKYGKKRIQLNDRYVKEANGLRIKNITEEDNGEYTCLAEVEASGQYAERKIVVNVHDSTRYERLFNSLL